MKHTDYDIIGTRPAPPSVDVLPLFAQGEAVAAREAAIQQANDHADPLWKEVAYAALVAVARRLPEFTADDVWAELKGATPDTQNPSALGPVFRRALAGGICVKTGRQRQSALIQRHREVSVWQSLIIDTREDA